MPVHGPIGALLTLSNAGAWTNTLLTLSNTGAWTNTLLTFSNAGAWTHTLLILSNAGAWTNRCFTHLIKCRCMNQQMLYSSYQMLAHGPILYSPYQMAEHGPTDALLTLSNDVAWTNRCFTHLIKWRCMDLQVLYSPFQMPVHEPILYSPYQMPVRGPILYSPYQMPVRGPILYSPYQMLVRGPTGALLTFSNAGAWTSSLRSSLPVSPVAPSSRAVLPILPANLQSPSVFL